MPDLTTETTAEPAPATVEEELAMYAPMLLDHFNGDHPDVVDVVARAHCDAELVGEASLVGITVEAITLTAPMAEGERTVAVPFPSPVSSLADLQELAVALAKSSRATLGINEPTSIERELATLDTLRTYVTSVVRVEQLTPRFRQITFAGGDLDTFEPGGLDTFLYVLLPPPGTNTLSIDSTFSWSAYEQMAEADRPVGAYYTLRRWRPAAPGRPAELDMVFLRHAEGHATTWAERAQPGDPVAIWGPRTAYEPPEDTEWLLLAGDETGLPAISVILENKPGGVPADVFVELDGPENQLPLPDAADITVHWIYRGEADAGTTTLLADAVKAAPLRTGHVYAWGGAESRSMTAIRKHLRHTCGFEQSRVCMVGYWRHATTPPTEE
jgi:NADPH-dependent ferric siderophore reductase